MIKIDYNTSNLKNCAIFKFQPEQNTDKYNCRMYIISIYIYPFFTYSNLYRRTTLFLYELFNLMFNFYNNLIQIKTYQSLMSSSKRRNTNNMYVTVNSLLSNLKKYICLVCKLVFTFDLVSLNVLCRAQNPFSSMK